MRVFRYIRSSVKNRDCDPAEVAELALGASMKDHFFVFDGRIFRYYCYGSVEEYRQHFPSFTKPELHEVIFGENLQRVKFDLDAKRAKADGESGWENIEGAMEKILEAIVDVFICEYSVLLTRENFVIYSSDGAAKWSRHILIDGYCLQDNREMKRLHRLVMERLDKKVVDAIDHGVNSGLHNFRLPWCYKEGRQKVRIRGEKDAIVSDTVGCCILPKKETSEPTKVSHSEAASDDDTKAVVEYCSANLPEFSYRKTLGNKILFDRISSSHCRFCNKVHDHDNTMYVSLHKKDGVTKAYERCWKDQSHKSRFLLQISGEAESALDRAMARDFPDQADLFHQLKQHVYREPKMRKLEDAPTLCVHSAMKMGKTMALLDYLQENPQIQRTTFVSFRQTFTADLKKKFPEFTVYSDTRGMLDQDKIIVQVESLHRIPVDSCYSPPDLLVLDECESIFDQFNSGLLKNYANAHAVFLWLLRMSRQVVCIDAMMTNRTFNILSRFRPGFLQEGLYHRNTYEVASRDTYHFTSDKSAWFSLIDRKLADGEKVAIPLSSLTEAKAFVKVLEGRYPGKKIKLYSSETLSSEKKDHFLNVNEKLLYDVLVYTPTMSAGVSFEREHYDSVFGYFTDRSCSVETCLQMIGRIRNVGTRNFYICIDASWNNLPCTTEEVRDWVIKNRHALYGEFDSTLPFVIRYSDDGSPDIIENEYYTIWSENIKTRNMSKNSFLARFVGYVKQSGATIKKLTMESDQDLKTELERSKAGVKVNRAESIAGSSEIAQADYLNLQERFDRGDDVSEGERSSYEKYKLRRAYNYARAMDAQFVLDYGVYSVQQQYYNLSRINPGASITDELKRLQSEEREKVPGVRATFNKHRHALSLVRICGWETLSDPTCRDEITMHDRLKKCEADILAEYPTICTEMEIKRIDLKKKLDANSQPPGYVAVMLSSLINKVLTKMYGFSIVRAVDTKDIYVIKRNEMFLYGNQSPGVLPVVASW